MTEEQTQALRELNESEPHSSGSLRAAVRRRIRMLTARVAKDERIVLDVHDAAWLLHLHERTFGRRIGAVVTGRCTGESRPRRTTRPPGHRRRF